MLFIAYYSGYEKSLRFLIAGVIKIQIYDLWEISEI